MAAGIEIITPLLTARAVDTDILNARDATFAGLTFFGNTEGLESGVTFGAPVEFLLPPVFNKDTAGFAIVREGDQSVRVDFEEVYAATPVVTASIAFEATDNIDDVTFFDNKISYIIKDKDETGFTILLNKTAPFNIRFSWIALGVKDANIFESLGEGLTLDAPTSQDASQNTAPDTTTPAPPPEGGEEATLETTEEAVPEPEPAPEPSPESTP